MHGLLQQLCAILLGESDALPSPPDDDNLLRLAQQHRVHRLLASRLSVAPEALKSTIRGEALLADVQDRELARTIAALEAGGLAPVVFKGAALAYSHYAEPWLRPRLDADLLIPPDRRSDVFESLRTLGYSRQPFISGELVMHQAPFVRIDALGIEHALDVHWRIANPELIARALSYTEIAARADFIVIDGTRVRVPAPVDALLLACVHRAAHHQDSERLLWLYDIHLIAERLSPDEWRAVVDLASERSIKALCARGLLLTQSRFGTRVDADALRALTAASDCEPSSVYTRKNLRALDRLFVDLRALGVTDGAHLLREHLFPPPSYMREMYGVRHAAALPAWYVWRILAGASKWLRPVRPDPR